MKSCGLTYYILMVALHVLSGGAAWAVDHTDILIGGSVVMGSEKPTDNYFNPGFTGTQDVFIGEYAGYNTTDGSGNIFIGHSAGGSNTSGYNNIFIGHGSGNGNYTGYNNTALGIGAGASGGAGTGPNNDTCIGFRAGGNSAFGANNTYIGAHAGESNYSGSYNTFVGVNSGYHNDSGIGNVFLGSGAGESELGSDMLYIDNCKLVDASGNCTRPLIKGTFDNPRTVSIDGALTAVAITTTGSISAGTITSTGTLTAGNVTTTGTLSAGTVTTTSGGIQFPDGSNQTKGLTGLSNSNNSFFGNNAGRITTGISNTFVGNNAGYSNTGGYSNTFFGYNAGYSNTVGYSNSFFGFAAGYSNTGYSNSFFGNGAGNNNTSGHNNTFIGVTTGYQNTSGSSNVFLGYYAGYSETGSNKLYIDNCFTGGNCNLPLIKGDFAGRTVEINGTLTMTNVVSPSDRRLKRNIEPLQSSLDKVMLLQGVSYEWKIDENPGRGFTKNREVGLIAQDVETVIPEVVLTDGEGYKALAYDKLVPVLIEAIKEQQKEIKKKDALIEKLEKAVDAIQKRLAATENPAEAMALK